MNMAEEISIATCHHEQYLAHCCSLVKDIGCEMISLECGRSCVRAPIWTNQRLCNWYKLLLR